MRDPLPWILLGALLFGACSEPDPPGADAPAKSADAPAPVPEAPPVSRAPRTEPATAAPESNRPAPVRSRASSTISWRFGPDAADVEPPSNWARQGDGYQGLALPGPPLLSQWPYAGAALEFDWRVTTKEGRAWLWIASERNAPRYRIALGGERSGHSPEILESLALSPAPAPGTWTRWRVVASLGTLSVMSDGKPLWARRGLPFGSVYLGFEVEGGALEIRDLDLQEAGYRSLTTADAWQDGGSSWRIGDGAVRYDGRGADLVTREEFEHYVLRAEWRIRPGGNSGLMLRGSYPWQVEIWDGDGGSGLYGIANQPDLILPPARNLDVPVGKWNHVEVNLVENRLWVWMNGSWIFSGFDLSGEPDFPSRGPIALQDHGQPVEFRNLRVAPLEGANLARWKARADERDPGEAAPVAGPNPAPLPAAESLARLSAAPGLDVSLVAAEPDVIRPVALCPDPAGNLYVAEAHSYRTPHPFDPEADPADVNGPNRIRYLVLEDGACAAAHTVLEGLADPAMGLALVGERLVVSQAEELLSFAIGADGELDDRRRLVHSLTDRENPYGFFRVKLGPDGWLWFSVGGSSSEEGLTLVGSDGTRVRPRGRSGGVFRCRPDGSGLELLVQGVRVPFAFDLSEDGSIWLAESGQLGPDRLIHAVTGSDYGFETPRGLGGPGPDGKGGDWIGPVWPLRGSFTSLVRYDDDTFPVELRGQLFVANWGSHGFAPRNRSIERFSPRAEVEARGPLLTSDDTHFRPTDQVLGADGTLYVGDWYGRDDESDARGRIWALRPTDGGSRSPDDADLDDAEAERLIEELASPRRARRDAARRRLVALGDGALGALEATLARGDARRSLACLWILAELGDEPALRAMFAGLRGGAAPRRALAWRLVLEGSARLEPQAAMVLDDELEQLARETSDTRSPEVRLALAPALPSGAERDAVLLQLATELSGEDGDERLRLAVAEAVARLAGETTLAAVWQAATPPTRLARIALAVALLEKTRTTSMAHSLLHDALKESDGKGLPELLALAQLGSDPRLAPALEEALGSQHIPVRELARGTRVLERLELSEAARAGLARTLARRLNEEVFIGTFDDRVDALRLIEELAPAEPPIRFLSDCLLESRDRRLQIETHRVLISLGVRDERILGQLRTMATKTEKLLQRMQAITTLGRLEEAPDPAFWTGLCMDRSDAIAFPALRVLRERFGEVELGRALARAYEQGRPRQPRYQEELARTLQRLGLTPEEFPEGLAAVPDRSLVQLTQEVMGDLQVIPPAKRPRASDALGQLVFWSSISSCSTCHGIDGRGGARGPALDGIGALSQPEYVVESILDPSRLIKAGYETEELRHEDGTRATGWVREVGDELWIWSAATEPVRWKRDRVASREPHDLSVMPSGLEAGLSAAELADLVAYLLTLEGP